MADRAKAAGPGKVPLLRSTMQSKCLRLMGKKLLVVLAMEGKFAGEGLQSLDEDDDMLTSMARELVEKTASVNRPTKFGGNSTPNIRGCFHPEGN